MDGSFQIHRTLTVDNKDFPWSCGQPVVHLQYMYDYIEDEETKVRQCYDDNM